MFKNLKALLLTSLLASFIIPSISFAQTLVPLTDADSVSGGSGGIGNCSTINTNIRTPDRVKATGIKNVYDDVFTLQEFLIEQGYFAKSSNLTCQQVVEPTGYYGGCSVDAVIRFKQNQGIEPADGYVGATTRGNIQKVSCGAGSTVTNTTVPTNQSVSFVKSPGMADFTVSPNTSNVKIGSFTIKAGSENITVDKVTANLSTNFIQNYTNLTIKTGIGIVGTRVGNPATSTVFMFNPITISANYLMSFDIYANVGSQGTTVNAGMSINYSGIGSGGVTKTLSATGVNVNTVSATLANPTLVSSSPVSQFVVGGSMVGIATFKLKTAQAGTNAIVRELKFTTTGVDAIESIIIGDSKVPVIGSGPNAITTITGLNIPINSTGTDIPVTVKFSGFQGSTSGGYLTSGVSDVGITLTSVQATSGSGMTITNTTPVSSNKMTLVASKPTVTISSGNTSPLTLGVENKIGEFTVTPDVNGRIAIEQVNLRLSTLGINDPRFSKLRVTASPIAVSGVTVTGSSENPVIVFTSPFEINSGQSVKFSVFALVNGFNTAGVSQHYVASKLMSPSTFIWRDTIGGNTQYTGANILNFPTNSYTTLRDGTTASSSVVTAKITSPSSTQGPDVSISGVASGVDVVNVIPSNTSIDTQVLRGSVPVVNGKWVMTYVTDNVPAGNYLVTVRANSETGKILATSSLSVLRPVCGLHRNGTSGVNIVASPGPASSVANTNTACIKYCDLSGPLSGDVCMRGSLIVKKYLAPAQTTSSVTLTASASSNQYKSGLDIIRLYYDVNNAPQGATIEMDLKAQKMSGGKYLLVNRYQLDGTTRTLDLSAPQTSFPSHGTVTFGASFYEGYLPMEGPLEIRVYSSSGVLLASTQVPMQIISNNTTQQSVSPTVEFIGTPTLSLLYDSNNKESSLYGKVYVKVTAGNLPVDIVSLPYILDLFLNHGRMMRSNNTRSYIYDSAGNSLSGGVIQPNTSATFAIAVSAPTRELIPGSYTVGTTIQSLQAGVSSEAYSNPVYILGEPVAGRNVVNAQPSSPVKIIGETSPYINSVVCDLWNNINCSINGARFNPTSNVISLNGKTMAIDSLGNGAMINFRLSDFNITQSGNYIVQVTNSNGASNNFPTNITVSTTVTTSVPTVEFIGTPTLSLQYDSTGKESMLVGKATVKITTGNSSINLNSSPYSFVGQIFKLTNASDNRTVNQNTTSYNAVTSPYSDGIIPANTTAIIPVSVHFKASELFAGSYYLNPIQLTYTSSNISGSFGTLLASSFINARPSNSVTIVGETSPYITSVAQDNSSYAQSINKTYAITGVRLGNTPQVTINNTTLVITSNPAGRVIRFNPSEFGITQSGNYIVQVSNNNGASNRVAVDIKMSSPTTISSTPTVATPTVAAPTTSLTLSTLTCVVPVNSNSCNITAFWNNSTTGNLDIYNVTSGVLVSHNIVKMYLNEKSGSVPVGFNLASGSTQVVQLRASANLEITNPTVFDSKTINVACIIGSSWNGTSCATPVVPTQVIPTPTIGAKPTATITANGINYAVFNVGDTFKWKWSSVGGTSYTSSYTATGCTATSTNRLTPISWSAKSAIGELSRTLGVASAGCTLTVTYKVSNSSGTTTAKATVKVNPVLSTVNQYTIGGVSYDISAPATCQTLVPISKGSWDSNSNGSVTALQKFLTKKYNLNATDIISGYYGDMTSEFVKRFQTENGLEAVGYVGNATRELIKNQCTN